MRIREAINLATSKLSSCGIDNPRFDVRLLLAHVLNLTPQEIMFCAEQEINEDKLALFNSLVERRKKFEPVAKIIGSRGFWRDDFIVTNDVLDPRPDSETLIEAVVNHYQAKQLKKLSIIDLGTGSGCLLLSLLRELPNALGVGVDFSFPALDVAQKNAFNLGLSERCLWVNSSWHDEGFLKNITPPYDIVICNPPYIAHSEKENLTPDVLNYEPHSALFAEKEGLFDYEVIAQKMPQILAQDGSAWFEIGFTQAVAVENIFGEKGFSCIEKRKDLGGHIRCLGFSVKK